MKVVVTRFKDGSFMVSNGDKAVVTNNIAEVASSAAWWSGISYKVLRGEIFGMSGVGVDMLEISKNTIRASKINYGEMWE